MKVITPDYYGAFSCIAGQCGHSCCIGWEIDIDYETLQKYRSVPGEWGKRLKNAICQNGKTAYFRLAEGERCPFLNERGLCDLIVQFGEDFLCQICTDHPRFRHFFSTRIEIGLGLCCEEAGRLILAQVQPVQMSVLEQNGDPEKLDLEEEAFFAWRNMIVQCAQNRALPIEERIRHISRMGQFDLSKRTVESWHPLMLRLERMDEAWTVSLRRLLDAERTLDHRWEIPLEQLLVYLILRHLPTGFEEDDLRGYLAFVILMWKLLYQMFTGESMEELVELARLYSSEIEYSDENVEKIIDELYQSIL